MKAKPRNNLPEGLGGPALRALRTAGITSLEELSRFNQNEIMRMHGIGPNAMGKLHAALLANGLSFREQAAGSDGAARKGMA